MTRRCVRHHPLPGGLVARFLTTRGTDVRGTIAVALSRQQVSGIDRGKNPEHCRRARGQSARGVALFQCGLRPWGSTI